MVDWATAKAASFSTANCSSPYSACLSAKELSKSSFSLSWPRVLVKRKVKTPLELDTRKNTQQSYIQNF
jgi:hypothetical protein